MWFIWKLPPSSLGIALLPTLQLCALLVRVGNVAAWGKRELWVQSRPCSSFPSLSFAPLRTPHPCPFPHVRCGDRSHPPKAITGGSRWHLQPTQGCVTRGRVRALW